MHMLAWQKWRQGIPNDLLEEIKEEKISTKRDNKFSGLQVNK